MNPDYFEKRVLNSIPNILTYWDTNMICRFANQAFSSWYGIKSEDLIDKMTAKEVFGPIFELNLPFWEKAILGVKQEFKRQIKLQNGEIRHVLAIYIPDIVNNEVIGIVVQVFDVIYQQKIEDELKESKIRLESAFREMERQSRTDALTGIHNRRYFNELLESEWNRSVRFKHSLSVIIIDIDFYKEYNDHLGHLKGDECLVIVAKTIKNVLQRSSDMAFRYGGDEFVILLPETPEENAVKVTKKIQEEIANLKIPHPNSPISQYVTVSIGIFSNLPAQCHNSFYLVKIVDEALYESKKLGRNQFTVVKQTNKC